MTRLLLLLYLMMLTSCPVSAQEEEESVDEEAVEETEQRAQEPSPQADNLRNRDLGEAFRNFRPSEEISADNAVSFPVDI